MKILILGGTGAMGTHLVDLLAKKDVEILVTSRGDYKNKGNIKYIQGDAMDLGFLNNLLQEKWDVIVDFMIYTTPIFKLRVKLLLSATKQYIFLSSARVYAESKIKLTEKSLRLIESSKDQEYLNTDEYALTKARQEDVLRDSGFHNWTIIRPYITYAENRLQLGVLEKEDWLYRALMGRTIVFSEAINEKLTTMTYGRDVAQGICSLIGKDKACGEAYHITANQSLKWENVLDIYLNVLEKYLGSRPKVIFQKTETFIEWRQGKYQVLYDRLYDRTFNNLKVSEFVDISTFKKTENELINCLELFIEKPQFTKINWKNEALKDRYTKEHTSINEIKGLKNKIRYIIYRNFNWLIESVIKRFYKKIIKRY